MTTPPSSDLRIGGESGATLKKDMFPDEVGERGEVGGEPTNDLLKSSRKLNFVPDLSVPPSATPVLAGAVAGVGAVMVGG